MNSMNFVSEIVLCFSPDKDINKEGYIEIKPSLKLIAITPACVCAGYA